MQIPVNANTRRLAYSALAMILMSGVLLSVSIAGWFFRDSFPIDEGVFRLWNTATSFVMGLAAFALGFTILKVWQREREAITLIDWLRGMDEITSSMRYPINSDILRPVGEWVGSLFSGHRGWIMLIQVPGILISGEVVRRKYILIESAAFEPGWDPGWAEALLRSQLDDEKVERFGKIHPLPEKGAGSCASWGVRSKDGDMAIGVLVALDPLRAFTQYPLFDDIITAALGLVVKRLSVLLVDVVDRREKLGSEGLGLLFRMLVHELSNELQGAWNQIGYLGGFGPFCERTCGNSVRPALEAVISRATHWIETMKDAPLLQDRWVPITPEPTGLDTYMNAIVEDARKAWPDATFVVRGSKRLVVQADRLVRSVLRNVIFNAGSFSPEDGIVSITVSTEPEFALIRVQDEGPGVSDQVAQILFDASVPSEKRPNGFKGMGVGLAAARAIARAYGGDLVCYPHKPDEACGGDFELRLPLVADQ